MKLFGLTLPISRLKLNLLANFAGQGWSAIMGLAFIPLYIQRMGIEAYGLVGFYLTLQGVLQILDFGLSPTMNREMARYSVHPEKADEARDFVRTLEVGYWGLGIVIGLSLIASAPFFATRWIQANTLSIEVIQVAIKSIAVMSTLQWPLTLYLNGLQGLQRQAELNRLQMILSTIRNVGAALILWLVSPTVIAFFVWQIFVNAIQIVAFTRLFWQSAPRGVSLRMRPPRPQFRLFRQIGRFATGVSGITFASIVLTQVDKIVLSKILTLEQFGHYSLAVTMSTGLSMLNSPVFNVVFANLSALVAVGDSEALKRFYHRGTQAMTVIVMPIAAVVIVHAYDLVWLWTGDAETAQQVAPLARLLVAGTALNSLMHLPYALQLAHGWTSLSIRVNLVLVAIMFPALFGLTLTFGPIGAASTWVLINSVYVIIGIPLTHHKLLSGEAWRWLWQDVTLPLGSGLISLSLLEWLTPTPVPLPWVVLPLMWLVVAGATALAASHVRQWAFEKAISLKAFSKQPLA